MQLDEHEKTSVLFYISNSDPIPPPTFRLQTVCKSQFGGVLWERIEKHIKETQSRKAPPNCIWLCDMYGDIFNF